MSLGISVRLHSDLWNSWCELYSFLHQSLSVHLAPVCPHWCKRKTPENVKTSRLSDKKSRAQLTRTTFTSRTGWKCCGNSKSKDWTQGFCTQWKPWTKMKHCAACCLSCSGNCSVLPMQNKKQWLVMFSIVASQPSIQCKSLLKICCSQDKARQVLCCLTDDFPVSSYSSAQWLLSQKRSLSSAQKKCPNGFLRCCRVNAKSRFIQWLQFASNTHQREVSVPTLLLLLNEQTKLRPVKWYCLCTKIQLRKAQIKSDWW